MSISPAVMALRTTGVAPSWMRSWVLMPLALSISRITLPSTEPSVSILDETTTSARAAFSPARPRARATASDFRTAFIGSPRVTEDQRPSFRSRAAFRRGKRRKACRPTAEIVVMECNNPAANGGRAMARRALGARASGAQVRRRLLGDGEADLRLRPVILGQAAPGALGLD